jgi:endoglucanase
MLALLLLLAQGGAAQLVPSDPYSPPPPTAGTSPSNSTPNAQWSAVLGNALWFYDAQRSGRLDAGAYPNRVGYREDSAVDDGEVVGLDLSGGWYDAGDVSMRVGEGRDGEERRREVGEARRG